MLFIRHHIKKQFSLCNLDFRMNADIHFCQHRVTMPVGDSQKNSLTPVLLLAKLHDFPVNCN